MQVEQVQQAYFPSLSYDAVRRRLVAAAQKGKVKREKFWSQQRGRDTYYYKMN